MKYLSDNNVNNIFMMICGSTAPHQITTILSRTAVGIELFKDLRTWFVISSACTDFSNCPILNDVETIIEDKKKNSMEKEVDRSIEIYLVILSSFFNGSGSNRRIVSFAAFCR